MQNSGLGGFVDTDAEPQIPCSIIPFHEAVRNDNPYQRALHESEDQRYFEKLDSAKVGYDDFLLKRDSTDFLHFKNFLQVEYLNANNSWAPVQLRTQMSLIHLSKDLVEFDASGRILDPAAILVEGYWATQLLGDLLPFDYDPPLKKRQ